MECTHVRNPSLPVDGLLKHSKKKTLTFIISSARRRNPDFFQVRSKLPAPFREPPVNNSEMMDSTNGCANVLLENIV